MSECQKLYTEREYVLAQREAFIDGYITENDCTCDLTSGCSSCRDVGEVRAAARYPLPKVTRPRVVADPECGAFEWSVVRGELHVRNPESKSATEWGIANGHDFGAFEPTRRRVQVWADLLANPTEKCEMDE